MDSEQWDGQPQQQEIGNGIGIASGIDFDDREEELRLLRVASGTDEEEEAEGNPSELHKAMLSMCEI
jgi:hypothetical protein